MCPCFAVSHLLSISKSMEQHVPLSRISYIWRDGKVDTSNVLRHINLSMRYRVKEEPITIFSYRDLIALNIPLTSDTILDERNVYIGNDPLSAFSPSAVVGALLSSNPGSIMHLRLPEYIIWNRIVHDPTGYYPLIQTIVSCISNPFSLLCVTPKDGPHPIDALSDDELAQILRRGGYRDKHCVTLHSLRQLLKRPPHVLDNACGITIKALIRSSLEVPLSKTERKELRTSLLRNRNITGVMSETPYDPTTRGVAELYIQDGTLSNEQLFSLVSVYIYYPCILKLISASISSRSDQSKWIAEIDNYIRRIIICNNVFYVKTDKYILYLLRTLCCGDISNEYPLTRSALRQRMMSYPRSHMHMSYDGEW
jgi:hypothetical protein